MKACGFLLCLLSSLPLTAAEPDWPQFRGPKRDGLSTDKNLLKSWPDAGPPLAWKATGVGVGFSSVAVVGDKVLTMGDKKVGADKNDACFVVAVKRSNGEKLWETSVGPAGGNVAGPCSTPTVDGDAVYALNQFGILVCLALADGTERWRVDLPKDYKGVHGDWQYAESPLVDGDKLVCTPGGHQATMLALDKKTGKMIWKGLSPKGEAAGYSSIVISQAGGTKQYVTLTSNSVVSFDAETGKLLWRYGSEHKRFADNTANIPTVVLLEDPNQIFAAAGYGRGGGLIGLASSGDKIDAKEEYWSKELANKHGGVIRVGGFLYGDHDDNGRFWCADAKTGEVKWTRKDKAKGDGSAAMVWLASAWVNSTASSSKAAGRK